MKRIALLLFGASGLIFSATPALAQQPVPYVFGFLRRHPERKEIPQAEAEAIQKRHLEHLGKMARDHGLVGAGPLADSPDLRGVLIFKGTSLADARAAAAQDPAVVNQRLRVDLADWLSVPGIGDALAAVLKSTAPDAYKMTRHGMAVLWKTPATPADPAAAEFGALRKRHLEQSMKLVAEGKLLAFGPMAASKDFLGVMIYSTTDLQQAMEMAKADPLVAEGWARPEAFVWFVAEGVMPVPAKK